MKKKEDLRVIKTKMSLYKGLLELMKTKTFENIKVSEICTKSMINRSTFYDHFSDKYELFQSLIDDLKEGLINDLKVRKQTNSIKEYYIELVDVLLFEIDKKKDIFSSIIKNNNNSITRDMLTYTTINAILNHINENYINKSSVDTYTIVFFYVSGIINLILASLEDLSTFDRVTILNNFKVLIPDIDYFELKK